MTDNSEQENKRPLSLGRPGGGGRLELRKPIETGQVRQSFPHGRSKTVQVEVRRKRAVTPERPEPAKGSTAPEAGAAAAGAAKRAPVVLPRGLTAEELATRQRAVRGAVRADEEARRQAMLDAQQREAEEQRLEQERLRREEERKRREEEEQAKIKAEA